VSRRLVYLQFADRDALLVEAAVDLVRRELLPRAGEASDSLEGVTALARHFAEHRSFYRAMLTGSCAFALTATLNGVFGSLNGTAVRELFGETDQRTAHDLAAFVAAGTGAIVNDWLIAGDDPLDPEELTDRLLRLRSVFADGHQARAQVEGGHDR
jgi:AcrR family transcriptional regulator